jgi:hypothetical protein
VVRDSHVQSDRIRDDLAIRQQSLVALLPGNALDIARDDTLFSKDDPVANTLVGASTVALRG